MNRRTIAAQFTELSRTNQEKGDLTYIFIELCLNPGEVNFIPPAYPIFGFLASHQVVT